MKKLLSALLAAATAVSVCGGLAACGEDSSKTLTVWAPSVSINTYRQLAKEWKAENSAYKDWTVKFEPQEEDVVQDRIAKTPSTKAHIFFFPSDHTNALVKKNILQKLPESYRTEVEARDDENAVQDAVKNGEVMAFPATYDNGYFLYYDKKVYTDASQVETLESLQSIAKNAGKSILYNYGSGYYAGSMFWAAGVKFGYTDDSLTQYQTDVDSATGKAVGMAIYNYFNPSTNGSGNSQVIIDGDVNTAIGQGLAERTLAAGIGGTWCWANIQQQMEAAGRDIEDIGIAVLPKFTYTVDNETKETKTINMVSFIGYKYCGVNAQKKDKNQIKASLSLASFFTSKRGQELRFKNLNAGPSNKELLATEEVKNNKILKVFHAQKDIMNLPQKDHPSAYWSPTFIKDIVSGTTAKVDVAAAIDTWAASLRG